MDQNKEHKITVVISTSDRTTLSPIFDASGSGDSLFGLGQVVGIYTGDSLADNDSLEKKVYEMGQVLEAHAICPECLEDLVNGCKCSDQGDFEEMFLS